jgi:hypothetical protein
MNTKETLKEPTSFLVLISVESFESAEEVPNRLQLTTRPFLELQRRQGTKRIEGYNRVYRGKQVCKK